MPIVTPKTNFLDLLEEVIQYIVDAERTITQGNPDAFSDDAIRLRHKCEKALRELEELE